MLLYSQKRCAIFSRTNKMVETDGLLSSCEAAEKFCTVTMTYYDR